MESKKSQRQGTLVEIIIDWLIFTGPASTEFKPGQDDIAPETTNTENPEPEIPEEPAEETPEVNEPFDILDILNQDCLMNILSYIPITDLIRSERVSKRWQSMVQEYLQSEYNLIN